MGKIINYTFFLLCIKKGKEVRTFGNIGIKIINFITVKSCWDLACVFWSKKLQILYQSQRWFSQTKDRQTIAIIKISVRVF